MERRKVGTSDLEVSPVGLGTWAMGNDFFGTVNDADSIDAIHAAIDNGINLIDTAPAYGSGHAEEVVGKALEGCRESVVVATKVGVTRSTGGIDLSPTAIRTQVEGSLRRLKIETIDLYQIHYPDPKTPLEETMQTLVKIQEEGKIRHICVSNFDEALMDRAKKNAPIVSLQPQYSLINRDIERGLVPYCLEHQIGLITYGTLAGGILTGKYREIPSFSESDRRSQFYDYFHEPIWSGAQRLVSDLETIARNYSRPVAEVVINWLYWQPGITAVLVGAKNADQARMNAGSMLWELSSDDLDEIDDLSTNALRTRNELV